MVKRKMEAPPLLKCGDAKDGQLIEAHVSYVERGAETPTENIRRRIGLAAPTNLIRCYRCGHYTSEGTGAMLKHQARDSRISPRRGLHPVRCRDPRVHEAWQQSSHGVFSTCPMCDRDPLAERPFSHY
jgi:hypothetical protein